MLITCIYQLITAILTAAAQFVQFKVLYCDDHLLGTSKQCVHYHFYLKGMYGMRMLLIFHIYVAKKQQIFVSTRSLLLESTWMLKSMHYLSGVYKLHFLADVFTQFLNRELIVDLKIIYGVFLYILAKDAL